MKCLFVQEIHCFFRDVKISNGSRSVTGTVKLCNQRIECNARSLLLVTSSET